MKISISKAVVFVLWVGISVVQANGYKLLCVKSSRAIGMADAFVAKADDPSAVTFNPAGLAQLRGLELDANGILCNTYTRHEAPDGTKTDNEDQWQFVPSFFASYDFGQDNMAGGFGVSLPNGISSEWGKDSFARYVATYSDLTVIDVAPSFGIEIVDGFMLGAGLDYYYSKARLEQMVDMGAMYGAPGTHDVESKLKGDGDAWGYNLGAIWQIKKQYRLALTYRCSYDIDYDGDVRMAGTKTDVDTTMKFPAVIVAGFGWQPTERWYFEVDVDWTEWSAVGDTTIHFDDPLYPDRVQENDYHNTIACKVGMEYKWSDSLDLRAGFIYNQNATAERTWRPSLPDSDNYFLTAGIGYHVGRLSIDGALQMVIYETRNIDNNVDNNEAAGVSSIDGKYNSYAPCVSLGVAYVF